MTELLNEAAAALPDGIGVKQQIVDSEARPIAWETEDSWRDDFVLVAKKYAHKSNASFMKLVITGAKRHGFVPAFYTAREGEIYVFDAEMYDEKGIESHGDSKKEADVTWLERPLEDAVTIEEYLDGMDPATVADTLRSEEQGSLTNW